VFGHRSGTHTFCRGESSGAVSNDPKHWHEAKLSLNDHCHLDGSHLLHGTRACEGFGLHCVQSLMVDKGLPWAAIRRVHVKFDKLIEGERAHDIDMYVDVPNEWLATLDRINAQSQAAGQPHQILILSKEDGAHRHSASKRGQK
jgi:hypothetical protein